MRRNEGDDISGFKKIFAFFWSIASLNLRDERLSEELDVIEDEEE